MPALQFLKNRVEEEDYSSVRADLRKIRQTQSLRKYVANSIFYSIISGIVSVFLVFVFSFYFLDFSLLYSIILTAGVSSGVGFGVFRLFLYYPSLKAKNREKEIEDMLPHAAAFMLSLSKGDYEPIQIFESLSEEEEYGEISREAGAIVRNSKLLGYSPTEAILDVAESTPSEEFQDFLKSFTSIIETGGSISKFLARRCDRYYTEAEEKQEENLEFLGVMAEVYVVSLGLGPVLGVVILILFAMMGQFNINLLYLGSVLTCS
ncbi:hypothetical protein AKJ50_02000 [candidate division MSBL1 archaeon SCGC-AAA382A13]|uniref:Type II secretion system protein GspF domain-containing protein n=1 Tax=candidate division MSBL1 archaeon SCGC-AAA382A13 TaxID=1698279 RepID=A0A133VEC4_9EURY|nr:hypothetical protein AKJ50_02000 [candidate division MSBL1 archaeon SCGC-AAA382A13]